MGIRASFWPSGIDTPPEAPTPGGTQGRLTAIGAVKPSARLATTFSDIVPLRTSGALGSTISMLIRRFLDDTHGQAVERSGVEVHVIGTQDQHAGGLKFGAGGRRGWGRRACLGA